MFDRKKNKIFMSKLGDLVANAHERYITLENAKILKELGFNWNCRFIWHETGQQLLGLKLPSNYDSFKQEYEPFDVVVLMPTQSVALKWLREVYDCCIWVEPTLTGYYDCYLGQKDWWDTRYYVDRFEDYEKAVEAGIEKALKRFILPNKEKEEKEKQ